MNKILARETEPVNDREKGIRARFDKLFIDGKWRSTSADMPVVNPATEEEIGRLPCADQGDLGA